MRSFLLILAFILSVAASAQQTVSCRVVDAETGEPLPYVSIYVSEGKGTLSNDEGDFTIEVLPEETLRFSCIGYEKLQLKVSETGKVVRLKPLTQKLREVMVKPVPADDILKNLVKQLKKDFSTLSWKEAQYFNRTLFINGENTELVESFMQGNSAINLRFLKVISGIKGYGGGKEPEETALRSTNVHHLLQLGPMIMEVPYWKFSIVPLNEYKRYKSCYDISGTELTGGDGQQIYKIDVKYNGSLPASQGEKTVLEGTLYVDAQTNHLLSFDCNLRNMAVNVGGKLTEAKIRANVEYRHTNGFTEVFRVTAHGESGQLKFRSLLFNIEGMGEAGRMAETESNLIEAIEFAGYDSKLWERYNIIQRTKEEEKITGQDAQTQDNSQFLSKEGEEGKETTDMGGGQPVPQELVYVSTDNTCYFLGDTLYYKAYVVRSDKGTPSDISQILYAELLNQDGYLVERQMLRLTDGQGHGSFCLPDTIYAGFYELRAYTRWQLNWGRTEHPHDKTAEKWFLRPDMAADYFRDYDKLYSRVFPIYEKPKGEGEYSHDMTLRPLRRYFPLKEEKPRAEVKFYPEGGSWVEGLPQRLAFEVNSPEGEYLDGTLTVYDSQKKTVAEAKTENRGRGAIEITAQAGEKYTAEFRWGDGLNSKVDLPKREREGAVMRVEQEGDSLKVSITAIGNVPDSLGLTVMMNGVVRYKSEEIRTKSEFALSSSLLPSGVAQLTLYDQKGQVFADRLVFIRHDDLQPGNIRISGLPEQGEPLEKVKLTVEAPVQATLSLAVRDKALSDPLYDNGTLLTEMLLGSQLKGFIPNPGWYFEKDDEEHRRALDLLMMVQGWRRFSWQETTQTFKPEEPFEKFPILRGDVSRYKVLDQEDYFYVVNMSDYALKREEMMPSGGSADQRRTSGGSYGPILQEPLTLVDEPGEVPKEIFDGPGGEMEKKRVQPGETRPFLYELPIKRGNRVPENRTQDDDSGLMENMNRDIIFYSSMRADPSDFQSLSPLKEDVNVHVEFAVPVKTEDNSVAGDIQTKDGQFSMQTPVTNGYFYMHMAATQPGKDVQLVADADEYPDYSVRVRPFHPHYVKPYDFYQTRLAHPSLTEGGGSQGVHQMKEVPVGAKRGGLRGFDPDHPALIVDAYETFNQVVDAGLSPAWYAGSLSFSIYAARLIIGDMGVQRSYELDRRWDGKTFETNMSYSEQLKFNHLRNLNRISIYTDYAPRLESDKRYQAANQPTVTINLESFKDEGKRTTWRDRNYVLPGFSVCEDFYQPDYSKRKLPEGKKDYRRTLYWNPDLKLDEKGKATITFYNNSRRNQFSVSAEGISDDGILLWNK